MNFLAAWYQTKILPYRIEAKFLLMAFLYAQHQGKPDFEVKKLFEVLRNQLVNYLSAYWNIITKKFAK